MLPITWFVVFLWLEVFVFVFWLSVSFSGCERHAMEIRILGYCKYDIPFLLLSLFCEC
jgi:hypothetical protein